MVRRLERMEEDLRRAQSTIASLARTHSDRDDDVSGEYDIAQEVLDAVPDSFVQLNPLTKKERRTILREHLGVYPEERWPKSLTLKDATKLNAEVKKAKKIELTELAQIVSRIMDRNAVSTKMTGTA